MDQVEICGQFFDQNSTYFSFEWPFTEIVDMAELQKLKQLIHLESVSLSTTNLNDTGLKFLCENLGINNLNLQDTQITNAGIAFLSQLNQLTHLRLKENFLIDNNCVLNLNKLKSLINLQIHETNINENGYQHLNLPNLKSLLLNDGDRSILAELSKKMPQCSILVKGKVEFLNGVPIWER